MIQTTLLRCSENHERIKAKLFEIGEQAESIDEFASLLDKEGIVYESISLTIGKELLIFTGDTSYQITGCAVRYWGKNADITEIT